MVKGRATLYEEVLGTYSDSESSVSETAGTTLSVGNRAGLTAVRPLWITSITYLRNNPELDTPAAFAGSHRLITRMHLSQPQCVPEQGGEEEAALHCALWVIDGSLTNVQQKEQFSSLNCICKMLKNSLWFHVDFKNVNSIYNKRVDLLTLKMSSGGTSKYKLTFSLHLKYMHVLLSHFQ